MALPLQLRITDYSSPTRWRWQLDDQDGHVLADHEVDLDDDSLEYRAFVDLPGHLAPYSFITPEDELLTSLGKWMGRVVFGPVATMLAEHLEPPATAVRVLVPAAATPLLFRPLELAHAGGRPLASAGIRFVYQLADAPEPRGEKAVGATLRVLAVFSQPHNEKPLNLRRERRDLEACLERLAKTRSAAVELRVLQYRATRAILRDTLEEGAGWDVVHFSGHGQEGELILEDEAGERDTIQADDLIPLLLPVRSKLKLLTLSACLSGAGSPAEARRQLDLEPATRAVPPDAAAGKSREAVATLPSLGQRLAQQLDCAVLAMRYRVRDQFARELVLGLYDRLLRQGQPLPGALQLTLRQLLVPGASTPSLALVTPILFGPNAAGLKLEPRRRRVASFQLPTVGLSGFPSPPPSFVGRVQPMLQATQALAPQSQLRGVLFHGMAGAGKTACALELAYRHEHDRFEGGAWWRARDEDEHLDAEDQVGYPAQALVDLVESLRDQLPGLDLSGLAGASERSRRQALLRLKGLLEERSILIVLDNVESLLSSGEKWRDSRWRDLLGTLLGHRGCSRVVLTSRRVPADLKDHPALRCKAIHALSLQESVLLAHELSALDPLFESLTGKRRLRRILHAVQGHPDLLRLADHLQASDPDALPRQLEAVESGENTAFFTIGETDRGPSAFLTTLDDWTRAVTEFLAPPARLLFHMLSRLEETDRTASIVEATWGEVSAGLAESTSPTVEALAGPPVSLAAALVPLVAAGLVNVERTPADDRGGAPSGAAEPRHYGIHPAVAATGRRQAEHEVLGDVDRVLGDFWKTAFDHRLAHETEGESRRVADAGRRAVPYLRRSRRWQDVVNLLEKVVKRDFSPATMDSVVPLLRQIAEATRTTPDALATAGILARALAIAGRRDEAEASLRDVLDRAGKAGADHQASATAGELSNLLRETGRHAEAIEVLRRKVEFTRRAGLGPWTRLGDETRRLQILNLQGHHEDVLAEVKRLWQGSRELSEATDAAEASTPWNVREALLQTGMVAAERLEQAETALHFEREIWRSLEQRGADPLQLAHSRFNRYGVLLRLGRLDEAREVLESCRRAFAAADEIANLGKVFTGLADLESREGRDPRAVKFQQVALRYNYQADKQGDCAISHHNLATYLQRSGAAAEIVLAHRLAAACIRFQIESGLLQKTLRNLACMRLGARPTFAEVAERVEAIDGVLFRDLFGHLPERAAGGDAAVAEVWQLALAEQAKFEADEGPKRKHFPTASKVMTAIAVQEARQGDFTKAIELQGKALWHAYQAAIAEDCAIGHDHMATYLECSQAAAETVLAHRLAAGCLGYGASPRLLSKTVQDLAGAPLSTPPSFAEIADRVEAIDGVRLRRLFAHFPEPGIDGDATVTAVWQMVLKARAQGNGAPAADRPARRVCVRQRPKR